jgi:hypothetical protein
MEYWISFSENKLDELQIMRKNVKFEAHEESRFCDVAPSGSCIATIIWVERIRALAATSYC